MLEIILLATYISAVSSSDCELSQWTEWSPCYGTCYFAQIVRNRDVIRPSLPDRPGAPTKRCPHLYETSFCTPALCKVATEVVDLPSESSRQRLSVKAVEKEITPNERIDDEIKLVAVPREGVIPRKSTTDDDFVDTTPNNKTEITIEVTSPVEKVKQQSRNEDEDEANSFRGEIIAEGRTALKANDSDKETMFTSDDTSYAAGIDLPRHLKPAKERKRVEKQKLRFSENEEDLSTSPISDVLRELESAADFRMPMDDKHIRSVLRKNRKLMRALVEAYKLRTTTIAPASTTTVTAPQEEFTDFTAPSPETNENVQEKESKVLIMTELNSQKIVEPQQEAEGKIVTLFPSTESTFSLDEDASTSTVGSYATDVTSKVAFSSESTAFAEELTNESSLESTTPSENSQQDTEMSSSTDRNPVLERSSDLPSSTSESTDLLEVMNTTEAITATAVSENEVPDITKAADVQNMMNASDAELEFTTNTDTTAMTVDEFLDTSLTILTSTDTEMTEPTATTTMTSTTTTTPPYWPKKGYVPNTRKHASEITSKLYMTQEIVQALSDEPIRRSPILRLDCLESRRCCKITRTECSDGSVPKYVKRFYRPRGSDICIPYHYPRCSQSEEMEEQPIQFEQNCQDICFKGPEKRISPLLTLGDNQ